MEPEEIYSVKEVSKILKVSMPQVRLFIKDGKLKAWNISRGKIRPVWKIKQSQLDEFMNYGQIGQGVDK
jgi:excisionase family DNA binding protein